MCAAASSVAVAVADDGWLSDGRCFTTPAQACARKTASAALLYLAKTASKQETRDKYLGALNNCRTKLGKHHSNPRVCPSGAPSTDPCLLGPTCRPSLGLCTPASPPEIVSFTCGSGSSTCTIAIGDEFTEDIQYADVDADVEYLHRRMVRDDGVVVFDEWIGLGGPTSGGTESFAGTFQCSSDCCRAASFTATIVAIDQLNLFSEMQQVTYTVPSICDSLASPQRTSTKAAALPTFERASD